MTEAAWRRRLRTSWPDPLPDPHALPQTWTWHFEDEHGNEFGRWFVEPAGGGERRIAAPGLPLAYSAGIASDSDFAVVGSATANGYTVHVVRPGTSSKLIYSHHERIEVGRLSRDQTLVCIQHTEYSDWYHPALRVLDLNGTTVADLSDGPKLGLWPRTWSPIPGDQRLIIRHQRHDMLRAAIWSPHTNEVFELPVELPGEVDAK